MDPYTRDSVVAPSQHSQYPHHYHHHHEPHHPNYNYQPSYPPHHEHQQHQHRNNQYWPVDNSQISQPNVPFAPLSPEASQTVSIPTISQDLQPPARDAPPTKDNYPSNYQSNLQENIQDRLNANQTNGLSTATVTGANEAVQPELSSHNIVPSNTFPVQDKAKTASTFPELNYMTSQVSDEFNKYFSDPKSKSTPNNQEDPLKPDIAQVIPPLIRPQDVQIAPDQIQGLNLMTSRVCDEFHKQFESPKSQPLPETQSQQFPDIENDPNPVTDRSNSGDNALPNENVPSNRFPELNLMTPRVTNEFNKYFSGPFPFEMPKSTANNENQTENALPKNTRPESQIIATNSIFGVPSQGGDTMPQGFNDENVQNRAIVVNGKNGLFHNGPALNAQQTRNLAPVVTPTPKSVVSTTTKVITTSISAVEEQTTLPLTTTEAYSPLENYNKLYYQPQNSLLNETKPRDEFDDIPVSENLKQLLRLYSKSNETGKLSKNSTSHVNGPNLNQTNPLASPKSTKNVTANVDNRNLQDTPITFIRPIRPNNNKSNHPRQNRPRVQPGFQHSPEFHNRNPQLNEPNQQAYHRESAHDPSRIVFPGPHSQSHPMDITQ